MPVAPVSSQLIAGTREIFDAEMKPRAGFTLVELMVVTVIIAVLAALAAPQLQRLRVQSYLSVLKADLHGLAKVEEMHRIANGQYVALSSLADFEPSRGVTIDFRWLVADAYAARAAHPAAPSWECWYIAGKVPPGHTKPVDGAERQVRCVEA